MRYLVTMLSLAVLATLATAQSTATSASSPATAGTATKAPAAAVNVAPQMPEKDPPATGVPVKLMAGREGQHPRLFLTAEQLPQLRDFYNSEAAAVYRKQFLINLTRCGPLKIFPPPARGWVDGINGMDRATLPTLALHYLMTGDKKSLARAKEYLQNLAGTVNWCVGGEPAIENTPEAYKKVLETMIKTPPHAGLFSKSEPLAVNGDTHAAYMLTGAAIAWDWLYNDLEPVFREQFRQILWQHARALYYGGYLPNRGWEHWNTYATGYHLRTDMAAGLTLGTLAAAEGRPEEQWMLGNVKKEMDFLESCLAPDGSQCGYVGFEEELYGEMGLSFQVADECLGTHHLDGPFFRNDSNFMMQWMTPNLAEAFYFASVWPLATYPAIVDPVHLKIASHLKQADLLDGIRRTLKKNPGVFGQLAWKTFLSDDPKLQGDYTKLTTTGFSSDKGFSFMRESWQDNAVAAAFKCGPPCGYHYNSWWQSASLSERGPFPQNYWLASPNANMFLIFGGGDYLADTDHKGKQISSSFNTILINKIGQTAPWRHAGAEWDMTSKDKVDVSKMGVITAYKDAGDVVVTEGEAAVSYGAHDDAKTKKSRPALDRFRRDFIWVKNGYILVLDDVRAPQPVEVTWLVQGAKLEPVAEDQKKYRLSKNKAHCDFQLLADTDFKTAIGESTAGGFMKPLYEQELHWPQLQASAEAKAVRFVSIYDPWHHQDLKLTFAPSGPDKATITVTGAGIADTWQWESAKGQFDAATIHGTREKGFDVLVDGKTAVPPPPQ